MIKYKLSVVFPGQGSQEKGMGKDIAESDKDIMELWKLAEKISGLPLREIYWDGDPDGMVKTLYQQPALCVVGISLWDILRPKASYLAGHSVGEFPALIVSKVLSLEDGLKLVSLRGKLMYEAGLTSVGKMAAILKIDKRAVEEIVTQAANETNKVICIANYNSPKQLVVSGDPKAVDKAVELAKQKKARAVVLPVSGAFHSPLMKEPALELAKYMEKLTWRDTTIPIYLNATATCENSGEKIKQIMKTQMTSSVLFNQIIEAQWEQGVRTWWELGPKGVLCGLIKRILSEKEDEWEAILLDSLEKLKQV